MFDVNRLLFVAELYEGTYDLKTPVAIIVASTFDSESINKFSEFLLQVRRRSYSTSGIKVNAIQDLQL